MIVYGYVRASTDSQKLTIEAQEEKVKAYCLAKDLAMPSFFADQATTSDIPISEREQGKELCRLIDEGKVSDVVVTKLDRAFRNTIECLTILDAWGKKSVSSHILDIGVDTATPQGRFFLTVIAAAAEMEKSLISERTKTVMLNAQKNGKRVSYNVPYGFQPDKHGPINPISGLPSRLIESKKEQEILSVIKKLHDRKIGASEIADELNENGCKQRNGKPWLRQTIWKLISKM